MNLKKLSLFLLLAVLPAAGACQNQPASADQVEGQTEESAEEGFLSRLTAPFTTPEVTVPEGTRLTVRLNETLSSGESRLGQTFTGSLVNPVTVDGKTLAPAGSPVSGRVVHVDDADKVKGRGELGIQLTSVTIDGDSYSIDTQQLYFESEGTKKEDAAVIGGAAGVGALVGALTGGKKGAAIGAAAGGGAGTGYVLATSGKEVVLPAETQMAFHLSGSVDLPEREQ